MITIALLLVALVCFIAATAGYPGPNNPRFHLGWLGAAFVVLSMIIPGVH